MSGLEIAALAAVVLGASASTYSAIEQNKLAKKTSAEQKKTADLAKAEQEKTGVQQTQISDMDTATQKRLSAIRQGMLSNLKTSGGLSSLASTGTLGKKQVLG